MAIMYRSLEAALEEWKTRTPRFPLIVRGARQVGKTYLIEKFGKHSFSSFVSVNFEAQPEALACFDSLNPEDILIRLQLITKRPIIPGKTLLFLDELQTCPQAILALRYFKEKLPKLHIIGAGSLLEFALTEKKFSFPVGRVQFMYLLPFSFLEYVQARGKWNAYQKILECTPQKPLRKTLHLEMLQLVKEYFIVGGMPAVIEAFLQNLSLLDCSYIHEILLSTYQADFSKYSPSANQKYLKMLFNGIFALISEHFKYSKIDPHIRSRELKYALNHLEAAGLFHTIYASSASGLPLSAQIKANKFKMLFLDIGLVHHALALDPKTTLEKNIVPVNSGKIAEQFVGQELLAYASPYQKGQLFYWEREKRGSEAEVDYLYVHENAILPIEVKAGPYGRLRSIQQFIQEKQAPLGIRISQTSLAFEKGILSVPFYLIANLPRLLSKTRV